MSWMPNLACLTLARFYKSSSRVVVLSRSTAYGWDTRVCTHTRLVFMQSVSNHVPWKARRKESRTKHSVSRMTSEWQSESPALAEQESSPCEFCVINPTLSVREISQSVCPRHWSLELVVSFALSLPPLVTESRPWEWGSSMTHSPLCRCSDVDIT